MKIQIGIPILLFFLFEAVVIFIFDELVVAAYYFALFFVGSYLALTFRLKLKFQTNLGLLKSATFAIGFFGAGMAAALFVLALNLPNPFKMNNFVTGIILVGLAPVAEEFLFRYAIFGVLLRKHLFPHATIVITSILFSLFHLVALLTLPSKFAVFVALQSSAAFFIGIILGVIRARTGSILPTLVLHSLFNSAYLIASL